MQGVGLLEDGVPAQGPKVTVKNGDLQMILSPSDSPHVAPSHSSPVPPKLKTKLSGKRFDSDNAVISAAERLLVAKHGQWLLGRDHTTRHDDDNDDE